MPEQAARRKQSGRLGREPGRSLATRGERLPNLTAYGSTEGGIGVPVVALEAGVEIRMKTPMQMSPIP